MAFYESVIITRPELTDTQIENLIDELSQIIINEKFTTERGRINCSLNDKEGWRWFGIQFVIK